MGRRGGGVVVVVVGEVSCGVRSVCHHSIINTQWCWSKGGRADGASEH